MCLCNAEGSIAGATCDSIGGQCQCKPGVTLKDCSRCKVNYYNFDSGTGCTGKTSKH